MCFLAECTSFLEVPGAEEGAEEGAGFLAGAEPSGPFKNACILSFSQNTSPERKDTIPKI